MTAPAPDDRAQNLESLPGNGRRKKTPNILLTGWRRYFWRRMLVLGVLGLFAYGLGRAFGSTARYISASRQPTPKPLPYQKTDILVVGGTPAGIAAAIGAARQGANVILMEERPKLGGDITYAYLNMFDVPLSDNATLHDGPPNSPVAYGVFGEVFRELGVAFDIDKAEAVLENKLKAQTNVKVWKESKIVRIRLKNGKFTGALVQLKDGSRREVQASVVIDATNDADVAVRCGAGYNVGRELFNPDQKMQSAGLLFSVEGVSWKRVRKYVRSSRALPVHSLHDFKHGAASAIDVRISGRSAMLRLGGVTDNYAWERGDIIEDYKPRGKDILLMSINFGRQGDGSVMLNTLNIVNVNGLSAKSKYEAHAEAVRELPFFIAHLRNTMPGFRRARIRHIAPELYIRETRHIAGFHALSVDDVRSSRAFPDRIALCSYPLDLHPYAKGDHNPFGPRRFYYSLPLSALVPRKADGVFVASRSLSATYSAAGSARVIPITMAAGEAAGYAAALCVREKIAPHKLVKDKSKIGELQNRLRKAGIKIGDELKK